MARLPGGAKVWLPSEEAAARWGHTPTFHDLTTDPGERAPQPVEGRAAELAARLRAAREQDAFARWQGVDADPETLDRLREMGYVR